MNEMFRFAHIEFLYALLAVPGFLILYILYRLYRKNALKRFGEWDLVSGLIPDKSSIKHHWKFWLSMAGYAFLVLSLARPQFGSRLEQVKRKGVELIIALDVSNSMLARDIEPSRLERAKQSIERLVDRLQDDRIGLIIFAGDAFIQVPMTDDYLAVKMFLSAIGPDVISRQGTAIGAAIDLAMNSFTQDSEKNRAIVIITDGENHEDDPVAAATRANEKGIIIHTLGIGLPQGAPVPLTQDAAGTSFRKDRQGNTVISRLDEEMLQKIAAAGGGKYIRSTQSRIGLNALYDEINSMEKEEMDTRIYSEYDERFQYMAGLALLLLLLEFFVLERKNRWFTRVNLFGNRNEK